MPERADIRVRFSVRPNLYWTCIPLPPHNPLGLHPERSGNRLARQELRETPDLQPGLGSRRYLQHDPTPQPVIHRNSQGGRFGLLKTLSCAERRIKRKARNPQHHRRQHPVNRLSDSFDTIGLADRRIPTQPKAPPRLNPHQIWQEARFVLRRNPPASSSHNPTMVEDDPSIQ